MSAPPDPKAPTSEVMWVAIGAGAIFLALAIWTMLEDEANVFLGGVAWLHVAPVARLAEAVPALERMPWLGPWLFEPARLVAAFLERGDLASMSGEERWLALTAAGRCATPIYAPTLLVAAIFGRRSRVDAVYRRSHDLESMIREQSESWPVARLARHVNPLRLPEVSSEVLAGAIETRLRPAGPEIGRIFATAPAPAGGGAWQRALRPEEWLVGQGATVEAARAGRERDAWDALDLDTVSEMLGAQLRTPWRGFAALRPCHRALAAAMALFRAYDIDGGNRLLLDLGLVSDGIRGAPGGMDAAILAEEGLAGRIEVVLAGEPGRELAVIAAGHAWLETAFASMLEHARDKRGVLAAASFLWLKSEDRPLWYILDNLGSDAVMIEAAGALAHYRAERQIGRPIRRPAVYQAARALLDDYLDANPARVALRRAREERGRSPARQFELLLEAAREARRAADEPNRPLAAEKGDHR